MTQRPLALLALAAFAAVSLAGCSSPSDGVGFDPAASVPETGKTVHLKMTVVDLLNTTVYPGLNANLWAFCAEPVDPSDTYSAAAISYFTPLPHDAPGLGPDLKGKCSVPGPTITVTQGDRVIVEFAHSHFHPHTIHWHGQYVPNSSDGVPGLTQEAVQTGQAITYDFVAKRAGTLWYHCHVDTHLHVMQGLYGLFIVKPQDTQLEPKADSEAVMVLSTMARTIVEAIPGVNPHAHPAGCFTSGKPDCQNPPQDTSAADVFLINGHSYPLTEEQKESVYHVDPGKTLRLRILNAGETTEALHLHGHDMLVTHEDGVPLSLAARHWVDTLEIAPGQRYDVLIQGTNPGVWAFHTHVNGHEANDQQVPGGMHTMLIDGPFGEHMHDFPGELPGGVPYQSPVYLPRDFVNQTSVQLGVSPQPPVPGLPAATGVDLAWSFPVDMTCAVQDFRLDASLSGTSAAGMQASSLTVRLVRPDGSQETSFPLGGDPGSPAGTPKANGHYELNFTQNGQLQKGTYTVHVTGTSAQALLGLDVHVHYYGSFDEIKYMHRLYKVPLCGRYGNGTDGLQTKAPPP
jgi:FtsP/CotA-like multicopper oxidase with cupredoxin domain